jgi:KaiC/GvpD/RAD55 family RecA-like ATPase
VKDVVSVIEKVKTQKGVKIEHAVVDGANHFFDGKVEGSWRRWTATSTSGSARRKRRRPDGAGSGRA